MPCRFRVEQNHVNIVVEFLFFLARVIFPPYRSRAISRDLTTRSQMALLQKSSPFERILV